MLEVQKYLLSNSLEKLQEEFPVRCYKSEQDPLVIFSYDDIRIANEENRELKLHPIVRECRGLVLELDTWKLVAKPFSRFFNFTEFPEEDAKFNWNNFTCQSKEDGSLAILYYYNGGWRFNTRKSFAYSIIEFTEFTWQTLFETAIGSKLKDISYPFNPDFTYVFELTSLFNKLVRKYNIPSVYLLSAFDVQAGGTEISSDYCDAFVSLAKEEYNILRPTIYKFKSPEEIRTFLLENSEKDPTFEGVIARDDENRRMKIKSKTYEVYHKMRGNNNFLRSAKSQLEYMIFGNEDEFLAIFPEVTDLYYKNKEIYLQGFKDLLALWEQHKHIKDKKEFVFAIQNKTKFYDVLFSLRNRCERENIDETHQRLHDVWKENESLIYEVLFSEKPVKTKLPSQKSNRKALIEEALRKRNANLK